VDKVLGLSKAPVATETVTETPAESEAAEEVTPA
jgi:hypothetical protein